MSEVVKTTKTKKRKRNIFSRFFLTSSQYISRAFIFTFVLSAYFLAAVAVFFSHILFFKKNWQEATENGIWKIFTSISNLTEGNNQGNIKRAELIYLSVRSMKARKVRTTITIGGMMVGIAVVVFLVSLGYGLQDLVIARVAKLEEVKQADVSMQTGRKIKITDKTLADFKNVSNVSAALPMITAVGKVTYNNSVSDMAVYAVPADFLQRSANKAIAGNFFTSKELSLKSGQDTPYAEAVVSQAMLRVLGLADNEAVGKTFSTQFVIMGDLLDDPNGKLQSEPQDYKIVGVVPETKTPLFYVPFVDLKMLGINNYSQVKVIADDSKNLAEVRKQIEGLGYNTHSVVDTVNQINAFFSTARILLGLIGAIALFVASLGMFNTLTVSLMERTREVGLMKTMGMKSNEVHELFLTESMIMGFLGGTLGIGLGYLLGKLAGMILSFFSISKGAGIVDVSSVPLPLIIIIVLVSIVVGIMTGVYPARRAARISTLNALRYE